MSSPRSLRPKLTSLGSARNGPVSSTKQLMPCDRLFFAEVVGGSDMFPNGHNDEEMGVVRGGGVLR